MTTSDNMIRRCKAQDYIPSETVTSAYVESISMLSEEEMREMEVKDEREKCIMYTKKVIKPPVELKKIHVESEEEEVVEVEKGRVAAVAKSAVAGVQKAPPLKPG